MSAAHWWDDIGFDRANMLLFRSEEHSERWTEQRGTPRGESLTLPKQWDLARTWFADRMDPGFRRRTVEEAQAVFEGLGLTGPFWALSG